MSTALLIDTETTGFNEPEVIELATMGPLDTPASWALTFEQRFKPSKPIEVGALATHHILESDLVNCPPWKGYRVPEGVEYIVGHGVDYDWAAIGKPHIKRICTLALARWRWPDIGSHKLGACIYHIYRDSQEIARRKLKGAHSATADVTACHELLDVILQELNVFPKPAWDWERVWELSEHARVPTVISFGKYQGMPIADLPWDYRAWILKQADMDPYLIQAVQQAQQQARR